MIAVTEIELFEDTCDKMTALVEKNELMFSFQSDTYPIVLSVWPDPDAQAQMDMLDNLHADPDNASINFIFEGGALTVNIIGDFTIPDTLMSKIKSYAKKMHYLYLQAYHREALEKKADEE